MVRRLLLVHAHPDDESLWTGGTIARYAAAGVEVSVVTCTLGEQGEVLPDELRGLAADAGDQLGGYRIGELRAACATLGLADQRFLGGAGRWRDSGMVRSGTDGRANAPARMHPRAFAGGDLAEQTGQLVEVLREVRPQVVVSYGPDGGYGHPDHIRAHEITMAAAAQVPVVLRVFWTVQPRTAVDAGVAALRAAAGLPFTVPPPGYLPAVPDADVDAVIDVRTAIAAKMAALRAHATQLRVWQGPNGERAVTLAEPIALPVLDAEFFTLATGHRAGSETDLFAGIDSNGPW
ncbi:MAG: N-acetyl-1-D-myo-inositol-2-amino-2-deoxy-alpha-D-glucopyranoside deacetylase [Jiangellaceae bacterium]